jgi:hypothetical protein
MKTHHNGHANYDEPTLCYGGSMQGGWGDKFHVGGTNGQGVEMLAPTKEVPKPSITLKANGRSQQQSSKKTTKFEVE